MNNQHYYYRLSLWPKLNKLIWYHFKQGSSCAYLTHILMLTLLSTNPLEVRGALPAFETIFCGHKISSKLYEVGHKATPLSPNRCKKRGNAMLEYCQMK